MKSLRLVWPRACAAAILAGWLVMAPALVLASDAMNSIVKSYLDIHSALASDKTDGIQTAAAAIASQAGHMGGKGKAIATAAKAVEQSEDLTAARQAFGDLSDAVIAAARAEEWADLPGAKVAYCAMAKRYWIQDGDQIRNPYFGSKMLGCGELQKR
jgi:hypothetical protein